ncbi:MAG: GumC family protein [Candidatus Hodarchaeota archaeon]
MKEKNPPSFVDYLTIIVKRLHFILKTFVIVTIAAIIISLIIPNQYTATATILPPNPQQDAIFTSLLQANMLSGLGGGGFSGLSGVLPGATTPSDLFAAILDSDRIMGELIQSYDLKNIFKTKTDFDTYKMLRSITKISVSVEGIVSVSVTWYDKYLATEMANSFVEQLDKYNTETAMTTGKKYRIFVEQRLNENLDSLKKAENAFRNFQEKHRTIDLDVEIESLIEAIVQLKAEIILLEVQKGVAATPGDINNPYVKNIDIQLRELKKQLAKIEIGSKKESKNSFGAGFSMPLKKLPEVALEYAGLIRDVKVQEAIYELLIQQYEQAKIMELKDTPTVQILDIAKPPDKKSVPKRSLIVILAAVFSLILGVVTSYILESFEQLKKRPAEYEKWQAILSRLKNEFKNVSTIFLQFLRKLIKR